MCSPIPRPLILGLALLVADPASAVIVDGANGTFGNNAEAGTLSAWLSSEARSPFPYFGHATRVSNASGTYLGYNAGTGRGWVLSANHVNPEPTSITLGGTSYTVHDLNASPTEVGIRIGTTDAILYGIGGEIGDPALPAFPGVSIASAAVTVDEEVLFTSRGARRPADEGLTAPTYVAYIPIPNSAPVRWGANEVDDLGGGVAIGGAAAGTSFQTTFHSPGGGGLAYEAQVVNGDSGGSVWVERGGEWLLAGMSWGATGAGADVNYGYESAILHLPTYRDDILAVTGVLIPEPGSGVVFLGGLMGILAGRRRRS